MNKTENNHDEAKQRIEMNVDVQKSMASMELEQLRLADRMSSMELVRLRLADRKEGRKCKYEY